MLSPSRKGLLLGLLILCVKGSVSDDHKDHHHHSPCPSNSTIYDPICTGNVTVFDTTTIISSTTVPVTHYVNVTHYVDVIVNTTETSTASTCITESTTTTLHYTVSSTETDSATITNTQTTTATVPATITTYTTRTIISTTVDPCPTTCSISVGTVRLFFWPTSRPYMYPSTYVDTALDYTFTSPSVYLLIPTAKGTNSLGPAGPSTTSWMLPLDLDEVSTIVDGTVTRQLTISDLGIDCPQTAAPSAIATMVDSRCDPILAAPKRVSSWAYPCNACGHFGLFDPPYAIPTLSGRLVETTPAPVTTTAAPVKTTVAPAPTSTPPVGVLLVVHYLDGEAVATDTIPATGVSGTLTASVEVWSPGTTNSISEGVSTAGSAATTSSPSPTTTPTASPSNSPTTSLSTSPSILPTSATTASATRVTGGLAWLISSICIAVFLL